MSAGVVARKLLWGRSGNECAYPGCSQALTIDLEDPESRVLGTAGAAIGEEAHIRSPRPNGPRYDSRYEYETLDNYANLILLCPTHHTLIDKDGGRAYTVAQLEQMRTDHELKVRHRSTEAELRRRATEERLVASIAHWEAAASLDDWQSITWSLCYPVPSITAPRLERLFAVAEWLLSRTWPMDFPHVREALVHFDRVLRSLLALVSAEFENGPNERFELRRGWKDGPWDEEVHRQATREFDRDSTVLEVLLLELTRAANWVITAVRDEVDPLYRFDEGVVLFRHGDGIFVNEVVRVEYQDRQWGQPFPDATLESVRRVVARQTDESAEYRPDIDPFAVLNDLPDA